MATGIRPPIRCFAATHSPCWPFGITTPLIQHFGRGVGSVPTAALLYAGAALASLDMFARSDGREAPVRAAHFARLVVVALVGAVFAVTVLLFRHAVSARSRAAVGRARKRAYIAWHASCS